MAACTNYIRLIMVAVLCFTHLICMNGATPVARSVNLVQKSGSYEVGCNTKMENVGEDLKSESMMRRMDLELNDYPGSGANNRHTPRPHEPGRGCIDC